MWKLFAVTSLVIIALLYPEGAFAQMCLGKADFNTHFAKVGAGASTGNASTVLSAGIAVGSHTIYGGGVVGRQQFDDIDDEATPLSAFIGSQVRIRPEGSAQLCPTAKIGYSKLSNVDGSVVDLSRRVASVGLALGLPVALSADAWMIPSVQLSALFDRSTINNGITTTSADDNYGELTAALGFVLNNVFSITPDVSIPFGDEEDGDPIVGLTISIGVGTRR